MGQDPACSLHGNMTRPGAIIAPDAVWQLLQSPDVCVAIMARSRPMEVTFALYGFASAPP